MTVCIAAVAGLGPSERILLCSDTRLESEIAGGDGASKLYGVGGGFFAMIAGKYSSARDLLRVIRTHFDGKPDLSQDGVADELIHSVAVQKRRIADHFVRARFAINYEEFLARKFDLSPELYQQAFFDIGQLGLECDVMVAGFVDGEPQIFTIRQDCHVQQAEAFACIGSGEYMAQGALCQRRFRFGLDLDEAMYYVYEAKRLSEVAPGVGPATHFRIVDRNGLIPLSRPELRVLEKQYRAFGLQPFKSSISSDNSQT